MTEWHVEPVYLVNNWTDELLTLMSQKLSERKQREIEIIRGRGQPHNVVSDKQLFSKAGNLIKVVKKNGDNSG